MAVTHDIPPHCCPKESGEECCVGVLYGNCRRCGGVAVFANDPCPSPPDPPWTWQQWRENWATHGRRRKDER